MISETEPPPRNSDGSEPLGAWQKWLEAGEAEVVRPGEVRLRDEHLDGDPEFSAGMTWQELSWAAVIVVDQAGGCDPERSQVGRVCAAWDSDYLTELVTIPGRHRTSFTVTTPDGEHAYTGFVTVDTSRVDIGAVRAQTRGWAANLSPARSFGTAVPAGGWVVTFPDRPDWNDVPVRAPFVGG